jgi:malonyl CoA-acyl carrier protein transacylase
MNFFMTMRAFIFPGQGSQAVGMGKALADAIAVAREVFQEVDDALGQKLFQLMSEGPEDQLTLTANAQPAIMANAIAVLRVLEKEGGVTLSDKADYVAGHSLGEYSALCAAGAFDLATTARLLDTRGRRCRPRCRSVSARWRRCSAPISRRRRSSPMRRPRARSAPSPTTMTRRRS